MRQASSRCRSGRGSASIRRGRSQATRVAEAVSAPRTMRRTMRAPRHETARADPNSAGRSRRHLIMASAAIISDGAFMSDAGEGLIDADARIQERMEELERERTAQSQKKEAKDPEKLRA